MNPSLAKALLAERQPGVQLLYGVATGPNTVEIAGSTVAVELPALESVFAGDYVAVLAAGADRLILGRVGGGVWTPFVPTLSQGGTVTSTNTWSRYTLTAGMVTWSFAGGATAAGAAGNAITLTLPVEAAPSALIVIGSGNISDLSAGAAGVYNGNWKMATTTTIGLTTSGSSNFAGVNPNFAVASGDSYEGVVIYEAA